MCTFVEADVVYDLIQGDISWAAAAMCKSVQSVLQQLCVDLSKVCCAAADICYHAKNAAVSG